MPTLHTQNLPQLGAKTTDTVRRAGSGVEAGGQDKQPKFGDVLSRETSRQTSREPVEPTPPPRDDVNRVEAPPEAEKPEAPRQTDATAKPADKRQTKPGQLQETEAIATDSVEAPAGVAEFTSFALPIQNLPPVVDLVDAAVPEAGAEEIPVEKANAPAGADAQVPAQQAVIEISAFASAPPPLQTVESAVPDDAAEVAEVIATVEEQSIQTAVPTPVVAKQPGEVVTANPEHSTSQGAVPQELTTSDTPAQPEATEPPVAVEQPAQPAAVEAKLTKSSESVEEPGRELVTPAAVSAAPAQQPPDATVSSVNPTAQPLAIDAPVATAPRDVTPQLTIGPQELPTNPVDRFAAVNHEPIVSGIRGKVGEAGGTMQIRLDPPELGALLINVTVRDGLMDATFQTANAEATQLLSHSLAQLKHSLESQGVSIDRLSVAQAAPPQRGEGTRNDTNSNQNGSQQNQNAHAGYDPGRGGDQQRRDMIRRMWARLGAGDPLDLVA